VVQGLYRTRKYPFSVSQEEFSLNITNRSKSTLLNPQTFLAHYRVCLNHLYRLLFFWRDSMQAEARVLIISLFNAQHVSDVNTFILRSLRLIC